MRDFIRLECRLVERRETQVGNRRHIAAKSETKGYVSGHLEESSAKIYHGEAVKKLTAASVAYAEWKKASEGDWMGAVKAATQLEAKYLERHSDAIQAGWKGFEPYCLRHSALTFLAENGCDAFTLARIAGHSSIAITQRYCHPQADAIERAFGNFASGLRMGTKLGTPRNYPETTGNGAVAASPSLNLG